MRFLGKEFDSGIPLILTDLLSIHRDIQHDSKAEECHRWIAESVRRPTYPGGGVMNLLASNQGPAD